jgi:hypothetical protein
MTDLLNLPTSSPCIPLGWDPETVLIAPYMNRCQHEIVMILMVMILLGELVGLDQLH